MKRLLLLLAVLAAPAQAWAYGEGNNLPSQDSYQDFSGATQSAGVAQTIAAQNLVRKGFCVDNSSAASLWVNFYGVATMAEPSFEVAPGERCFNINFTGAASLIGPYPNMHFKAWSW